MKQPALVQAIVLGSCTGLPGVAGVTSLRAAVVHAAKEANVVAVVLAFAAGAILTMLANTMMPEVFEHGGKLVGVVTTLGFAVSYAIHILG